MIYLVPTDFIPEALELGEGMRLGGKPELAGGIVVGVSLMAPLALI